MQVSCQLQVLTNLLPGEKAPAPTKREAGRAPEMVGTLWRRNNLLPLRIIEIYQVPEVYYTFRNIIRKMGRDVTYEETQELYLL
jgi:hypothetical protein